MEEILILIIQPLLELLAQVLASGLMDLLTWRLDSKRDEESSGFIIGLILFLLGCGLGWLSLLVVPHTLLPWAWLRVANLVAGPFISAWVAWKIGKHRLLCDHWTSPSRHAWYAASSCFGIVLVRFAFGLR